MELEKDEFAFPEAQTFKIDFKYIISVLPQISLVGKKVLDGW